jgi:Leucine-rich repeat (LRR) protein
MMIRYSPNQGALVDPPVESGPGFSFDPADDGGERRKLAYWSAAAADLMEQAKIHRISIQSEWQAPDLEALLPFAQQIEDLTIWTVTPINLSSLAQLSSLRTLRLRTPSPVPYAALGTVRELSLGAPASVRGLEEVPALAKLSLWELKLPDCRLLASHASLRDLTLGDIKSLSSLDGLEAIPLESLYLGGHSRLTSLNAIQAQSLRSLTVDGSPIRDAAEGIGAMRSLETLHLERTGPFASLEPIAGLTALRTLHLSDLTISSAEASIESLETLQHLRSLELIGGTKKLHNLTHLERLGALHELELVHVHRGPPVVPSIEWVRALQQLRVFRLQGTRILDGDLPPLLDLPRLEDVTIDPVSKKYSHINESFNAAMQAAKAERAIQR